MAKRVHGVYMTEDTHTGGGLLRALSPAVLVCIGVLSAPPALAQDAVAEAVNLDIAEGEDPTQQMAGFGLRMSDEDTREQIAQLIGFLNDAAWGEALRMLTELSDQRMEEMVAVGDSGLYMPMRMLVQTRLLSLPPAGQRAFRLYFDGQAREMLDAVQQHALPGSDAQLLLAQRLVDRMLASSVGGQAAELLGDLYFERGKFDQAHRNWGLALQQGLASGADALRLETKQAIALARADKDQAAAQVYQQLRDRYTSTALTLGGEQVDAIALLKDTLGDLAEAQVQAPTDKAQTGPALTTLPGDDAKPLWNAQIIDGLLRYKINNVRSSFSYYNQGSIGVFHNIPAVVADDQRVYLQWFGSILALDRQTGKTLWSGGPDLNLVAENFQQRLNSNSGDPQAHKIALCGDVLLVSSAQIDGDQNRFTISAFEKKTGKPLWESKNRAGWTVQEKNQTALPASVMGEILVDGQEAYVIANGEGTNSCQLLRFKPATGEVMWKMPLGDADPINQNNSNTQRMPQPKMMLHNGLLYVMTNNGALLAVDPSAREIAWARRLETPVGVEQVNSGIHRHGQQPKTYGNLNGSGRMLVQDGTIYIKEHMSKTLYAINPGDGALAWSADKLKPDAKLAGIGEDRFFLVDRAVHSYSLEGDHLLINKNKLGDPRHCSAFVSGDKLLVFVSGSLRTLETQTLSPIHQYENDHLGVSGGHMLRVDELLICIDERQITAFNLQPNSGE